MTKISVSGKSFQTGERVMIFRKDKNKQSFPIVGTIHFISDVGVARVENSYGTFYEDLRLGDAKHTSEQLPKRKTSTPEEVGILIRA